MTDKDLKKAIEVAEEAVAGFADDDSFEEVLALAVLELRNRLNNEREACAKICDEFFKGNPNINYSNTIAICIRGRK